MLTIRRVEEACAKAYAQGKIGGFLHLGIGQEAVCVGAIAALRPTDYVVGTYREHGHYLAKGGTAKEVLAELYGKIDRRLKGMGGSMHLFDAKHRMLGGYGIVGGHVPLARRRRVRRQVPRRRTTSRSASSATARVPQGALPRGHLAGRRCGSCPSSSSARTTSTRWARRSTARSRART